MNVIYSSVFLPENNRTKNHAPDPKKMTWMKQSHAAATLDYHEEQAAKNKNLELIDTGCDLFHLVLLYDPLNPKSD